MRRVLITKLTGVVRGGPAHDANPSGPPSESRGAAEADNSNKRPLTQNSSVPAGVYLFSNPRQRFALRIWPGTIQVSRSR